MNLQPGINKSLKTEAIKRGLRLIFIIVLAASLSGCIYWWRAYQTYLQMDEFDRYFSVAVSDDFTLHFKKPILYSKDFVSLSKLQPSLNSYTSEGRHWRYWFRKIDANNKLIRPEVRFYSDLDFNKEDRIAAWSFSSLFLQIAPPKFLEISLRSLGGAEINKDKMQLRADTSLIDKISADLPKKSDVLAQLGAPLEIRDEKEQEVYIYHFLLETPSIEEGYEDRALSEVKLTFDKSTQELIKMAGRFAGLKVSINYRKFLEEPPTES
ncbi:conserved hypothetical protein [Candidatus Methylobacter favarea]|uniref:Uncharacterized protein n=1 Tax=Candidatus Methylobacter favarea TaxID=2707345 RepID=A0A8S0XW21_9GAMM|nr:hypothetical protein [Candidatus Methylobacter favarea]CAA9892948.1 conserved hypothetical protein [Candidatus Methylobacter favarea]